MTPTPDPALAARLLELSVKSTQDPLNEDGRYFNGYWHDDLTQCSHGDTGNYSNKRDGQFIAALWNAYRSGQLITLADHSAAVQAAVANAVEAERARNNRSHSAATLFWVRASQKALAGDPRELQNRVDLCTADPAEVVLSAAAIRARKGGAL